MHVSQTLRRLAQAAMLLSALCLAACGSRPAFDRSVPGQLSSATGGPSAGRNPAPPPSNATTPRAYRVDAAKHLYALNRDRIYAGKLPPLLYAVGTLQVRLDAKGQVLSMHWARAPSHAPEVIAEIERTVLAAAPYPAPTQMGGVTWTDTWLWDEGGHFQLDTLSEGQLQE